MTLSTFMSHTHASLKEPSSWTSRAAHGEQFNMSRTSIPLHHGACLCPLAWAILPGKPRWER